MDRFDTIIIGAGMSGLAAGIRLAHFGRRVCILERHYAVGGLNSYYRLGDRNYDVGLHAVTNFGPRTDRHGPLARLLRQLRLSWDDFELAPQWGSRIAMPDVSLEFDNDPGRLEAEIAERFPDQIDGYRRLVGGLLDYDALQTPAAAESARAVLGRHLSDPLLAELLLMPVMFYGSASPCDLDFGSFSVLFRSIFLEGLARPPRGIRVIIKKLVRRYRELGGELRLRAGVQRLAHAAGEVRQVVLDDGEELTANTVLSSAGWWETLRLCEPSAANNSNAGWHWPAQSASAAPAPGDLSFFESVSTLDAQPHELGYPHTMVFFNDGPQFHWERPEELIDSRSGVICSPNNFDYGDAATDPAEGTIRLTALANFDRWISLDAEAYVAAKQTCYEWLARSAARFIPDFSPRIVAIDTFTPKTIQHFTGHTNGAVYGAARKNPTGGTPLANLLLCGTDQGLVGIIGAMTSGIVMANRILNAKMSNDEIRMTKE